MNILFFDTETTGLPIWGASLNDPRQPRLVQFGGILSDENGRVLQEIGLILKPEDFVIPEQASNIHGITQEIAFSVGIKRMYCLGILFNLFSKADLLVAHNYKFDDFIIDTEYEKIKHFSFSLKDSPSYCTMLSSTSICQMKQHNGRPKWPKLSEAYQFFFGEELPNAHRALDDVRGCMRLFFELKKYDKNHPLNKLMKNSDPGPPIQQTSLVNENV